jgi:hypothetical protein
MDFWGAVRTLRRRWYIALPAAVTAVTVALGVFLSIPTRYQSSGVMLLTSPATGGTFSEKTSPDDVVRVNPLLSFDGSLITTSQILAQILADPKTREESLGIDEDSTDTFVASAGPNGPLLFVTADSGSPEAAEQMITTVMEFAAKELDKQQTALKAPESTFIKSQVLVNPTAAEAQIGGKVRYAGAAFVLLMLLTTAATFGGDSVLNQLRRRREARAGASGASGTSRASGDAEKTTVTPPVTTKAAPQSVPPPVAPSVAPPVAPSNGVPRHPPGPPTRRPQPTASEQTVKIAAPGVPGARNAGKPGAPAWPSSEDKP